MTVRLAADATIVANMPEWVSIKSFYVNGRYAATPAQIAAWKGPRILYNVTGDPKDGGNALDVERYDATPAEIPGWFDPLFAKGERYLAVYCSRNSFDACTTAIGDRRCGRILATGDGTVLHTYQGIALDACQAFFTAITKLGCDLSLVFNENWHPGWNTNIPAPDIAELAHLASVTQTDLGRLMAVIKRL